MVPFGDLPRTIDPKAVSPSSGPGNICINYTGAGMRKLVWLVLLVVLAVGGWFAWALVAPVGSSGQTFVMLRPGYSTRRIAAELKKAGVIRSQEAFVLWHYYHHGRSLKAGEYLFDKPANIIDIQKRLRRGDVYFHTVVVPEGFTMFDIARAIEAAGLGPADDFVRVAQSESSLISDLNPSAHSLEGYLFPDTYQFSRMMTMQDMAAAMVKQFREVATQIRLIEQPYLSSPEASHRLPMIVTMASIVEKETAVPEERAVVASVYYNRLEKHIALDADPSIIRGRCITPTCSSLPLITPTGTPDFLLAPLQIPAAALSKPPCIRLKPTITTLLPMPRVIIASRARWKSTIRM
jgi:UPF0755 protein